MNSPAGSDGGGEKRRVAAALRTELSDGTYGVGSMLPTQRELAVRYGVSRDTVQRVLKELVSEGWIETRRGSGTRVLMVQRIHPAGTGSGLLPTVVDEAFEADEVVLDAFSLTSETLSLHLAAQVRRVREKAVRPSRVAVRLLLPDERTQMPYPSTREGAGDERLARRMHELSALHSRLITLKLDDLRRDRLVPHVSVQIRRVPLTPHAKLYLFNGTIALQGHYKVVKRLIELDDGVEIDTVDVLGFRAPLFHYVKDQNPQSQGSLFVKASQEWFDSLWDLLSV